MAIRERKGRKSPWQVYWNNPITGTRESANFATEQEAKKHDSLIKHRIKFDRESFVKEIDKPKEIHAPLTLEACYLEYLKKKQFNKKSLQWQIDAMRKPLSMIGTMNIEDITKKHIEIVMKAMQELDVKPVTVRGRMSVLRTVLRWCSENDMRAPVDFPKLPPAHYEKFVPPTPDELSAIILHAPNHVVRVIVIGAQLGVRVGPSELLRLTWDDVDLTRDVLRVHGAKKNMKNPWREIPIREALRPLFISWKSEDRATGANYIINYKGKQVKSIKTAWAATLRRAEIARRIRPYDLRHLFATDLLAAGVDVGTVSKLMGHSTPTMVLTHYQHVMDTQKRSAVESLPSIQYVPNSMCPKKKVPPGIAGGSSYAPIRLYYQLRPNRRIYDLASAFLLLATRKRVPGGQ